MSGCSEKLPAARGAGFEAEEDTSGYLKITTVYKGSSAELNGVLAGDIITAIDDTTVSSGDALRSALRGYSAGESATLTVSRNGETLTLTVTFDRASDSTK